MAGWVRWAALASFVVGMVVWAYGGWQAPKLVVGPDEGPFLFFLGIAVIAAYVPLYHWRKFEDRRDSSRAGDTTARSKETSA